MSYYSIVEVVGMLGLKTENSVNYLIAKNITGSNHTDINIIGWLNTEGELNTIQISTSELINAIISGKVVENIELDGDKIKYKGSLTEEDFNINTQTHKLISLGEVYSGDKIVTYIGVDKQGRLMHLPSNEFKNWVYKSSISNYYSTGDGEVRRMPNQNVSKIIMLSDNMQKILDIYPGLNKNKTEDILRSNNFRVVYQSELYKATRGAFTTYGWKDDDGALVWYTIDEMSRSIYKTPMVLLDCVLSNDITYLESNNKYNITSSKTQGHQWIIIQGKNILQQYRLVKQNCSVINKTWDMIGIGKNAHLDVVYCLDVHEDIENKLKELYKTKFNGSTTSSLLSHEIDMISMYKTLRKSSYENKVGGIDFESTFIQWNNKFKIRLIDEIKSLIRMQVQNGVIANDLLQYAKIDLGIDFTQFDTTPNGSQTSKRKNGLMDTLFKFGMRK